MEERMGYVTSYFGDITLSGREWDEPVMLFPHKCLFTGKWLMPFTKVCRSRVSTMHGPTSILYMEYVAYWSTPSEVIMQTLKGNV